MNPVQPDSPNSFVGLVVRISSLGFLVAVFISFRLWFNLGRDFPTFPVVKFLLPDSELFGDSIVSIQVLPLLLVCSLVALAVRPVSIAWLTVAVASTVVLVVADVHRLQPWVYQYTLTFLLAAMGLGRRNFSFRVAFLLVLFGTYFWSGLHKVNPAFYTSVLPYLARPLLFTAAPPAWLNDVGFAVPFVEASLAVGLLFSTLRPFAALGLIFMHLLILLVMGPLGHAANVVIWPWNVAMIAILLLVAMGRKESRTRGERRCTLPLVLIVSLFVVVPPLGIVGWWPSYLSMKLYAGNQTQAWIVLDEDQRKDLPPYLQKLIFHDGDRSALAVSGWSDAAIKVPAFPETDTLIHAANYLNATHLDHRGGVWLVPGRHPRDAGYFSFLGEISSMASPTPFPLTHTSRPQSGTSPSQGDIVPLVAEQGTARE